MRAFGIVISLLFLVAFWLAYYNLGFGIRWQEAYDAMGVVDGDADVTVQSMVENEPPEGMAVDKRLHPVGTLAKIRYQQLDAAGAPVASYNIRALLPALPYFGHQTPRSEFGRFECPQLCRDQLNSSRATLIERSGKAGLASEWLLRMPVGKTYSLGMRDLQIQDIDQEQMRTVPYSRLQVTLLDVCNARVRIGGITELDISTDTVVPILRGFRTGYWVQLEGCQALMSAAPSEELSGPTPEPTSSPPHLRSSWPDSTQNWEALRPVHPNSQAELTLDVDEDWFANHRQPLVFRLMRACRFDRSTMRWVNLPKPVSDSEIAVRATPSNTARVAYRFPEDRALYFAEWVELWHDGTEHTHSALVPSGNIVCHDNDLPEPGLKEVVACVPDEMVSDAMLVPAPETFCDAHAKPATILSPP